MFKYALIITLAFAGSIAAMDSEQPDYSQNPPDFSQVYEKSESVPTTWNTLAAGITGLCGLNYAYKTAKGIKSSFSDRANSNNGSGSLSKRFQIFASMGCSLIAYKAYLQSTVPTQRSVVSWDNAAVGIGGYYGLSFAGRILQSLKDYGNKNNTRPNPSLTQEQQTQIRRQIAREAYGALTPKPVTIESSAHALKNSRNPILIGGAGLLVAGHNHSSDSQWDYEIPDQF